MADVDGLRAIYNQVMGCKPLWSTNWHGTYQEVCEKVRERAGRLEEMELGRDPDDAALLERLIRQQSNGIASSGQSIMSREFFQSICENHSFLEALAAMMRDPSSEKYTKMRKKWEELADWKGVRRTPLLVNRVAAACTTDVSSTADERKFEYVYGWLIRMGLIDAPAEAEANWYTKNCHLMEVLQQVFQQELATEETDIYWLSIFVWLLYDELCSPFALKKQVVKYGPPGTGKTYQARLQAQKAFGVWFREYGLESALSADQQIETVQFHSSYGYESFIEGLQPVREKNGTIQLKLCDGTFKAFCKKAAKWEIDVERLKACAKSEIAWRDLTVGGVENLLAPGESLGAHWKYIRNLDPGTKVADAVPPFFFIIDEINRADLSRVFGELMYCLEYRGVGGALQTQYARLNDAETGMIKVDGTYRFFVPENVYLIGTMNTIDRSVESFDFALRRRFSWESVEPDMGVLRDNLSLMGVEKWSSLADSLERLNAAIEKEKLLGPDYRIGHAYLMNLGYPRSMALEVVREAIWEDSIKPLLEEYLRGTGKEEELLRRFATEFLQG